MSIWAIADLHLALSVPDKSMEFFGGSWIGYVEKIKTYWNESVQPEDLVLVPGDISWGIRLEEAKADLDWIHELPGTKVMLRGNHDYWWGSLTKLEKFMPPSIHVIQNNSFLWGDVAIAGSRLWDTSEYSFGDYIEYQANPRAKKMTDPQEPDIQERERIFARELLRLEQSLKSISPKAKKRIAMTHYPPIGANLHPSKASAILEKYGIEVCVFGHLHHIRSCSLLMGAARGVEYHLVAADYLNYHPLKLT